MHYSIGEISDTTGIAVSTLRYYDKEGLFPTMGRSGGGIRVFTETELETLKIIDCLKATGMPIKDIKRFFDWCQEGDASLQNRLDMFRERLEAVNGQMEELRKTMDTIQYKCWYYETAIAAGSEDAVKNIPIEEMPEEIRVYKRKYSK